jgi:hypothetical protein
VFVDDKPAVMNMSYKGSAVPRDITIKDMSIKDFLGKPMVLASGSGASGWKNSDAVNTVLMNQSIAVSAMGNSYYTNKIQGFGLWRGTAVIRVMINANPFMQGRLLLHFLPCVPDMSGDPSYVAMHNTTLAAKTMQPHLEIDCRDGVGILEIPYVAPTYFYDVKNLNFDWGNAYVTVLSQLLVGLGSTETTVDWTCYLYFKDIELAAPMVPQSNPSFFDGFVEHGKFKKSVGQKESEALSEKPVSAALSLASKAADTLSGIPILASVMGPVSWALDLGSGLASAFGWSKPLNQSSEMLISQQFNRYSASCDGPDNAYPLALTALNKTEVTDDITIRSEDEMSWNFLKKVDAWCGAYNWSCTTAAGNSILKFPVYPGMTFLSSGSRTE